MKTIKKTFTVIYEIAKALIISAANIALIDELIDDGIEDLFFESVSTNCIMMTAFVVIMIGCWVKVFFTAKAKDGE